MKNILLITSLYPSEGSRLLNNTNVCHYFAKEWKNLGYNVRVVFCYHCYPSFYYPFLSILDKMLADKFGIAVMCTNVKEILEYYLDGIKVTRIPIKKNRPGGFFSTKEIDKVVSVINETLAKEEYVPDYIVGHFLHPSIDIIYRLKISYTNAKTSVSIHGKEAEFEKTTYDLLQNIDYIGYRSYPIKRVFESFYGKRPCFMCLSGVPKDFIIPSPRKFERQVDSFIYIGSFMARKYPSALVPAISKVYCSADYSITFVGDGYGRNLIEREIKKYNNRSCINFTGRLSRNDIFNWLDKSDVFIMISRLETFGLVYLEAMARGCIVIASKDEGMEGIIQHGINGFLCKAGDVGELSSIIEFIKDLSLEKLCSISEAGRQTALSLTDEIVAKKYIQSLL